MNTDLIITTSAGLESDAKFMLRCSQTSVVSHNTSSNQKQKHFSHYRYHFKAFSVSVSSNVDRVNYCHSIQHYRLR